MLGLHDLFQDILHAVMAIDPGIALIVFVLTSALDGLHIVYTRLVMARRAIAAANSGAVTYLIYAFAIIESTQNWSYIAIMAAGSWVGTYLALRFVPAPSEAAPPPRRSARPALRDVRHLVRLDGLSGMRHHVGDDAPDMRVAGRVDYFFAPPLGAQHAGRAQQAQMVADQGLRELGATRDVRDANRRVEASEDDLEAAGIAHQAKHLGEHGGLAVRH
jgi:hypothetical protein